MNSSSNNSLIPPVIPDIHKPVFITVYAVLTIIAIIGNIVVVLTVALSPHMRSKTFILILNLAISDLIFAAMSPLHAVHVLNPTMWPLAILGNLGCSLYYFVFRSLYAFSVLILVIITCERFVAIIFPLKPKPHIPYPSLITVVITYLASFISSAPLLKSVILVQVGAVRACSNSNWGSWKSMKIYYAVIYTFLYIVPFSLMVILYSFMWVAVRKPPPGMTSNMQRRARRKRKMAYMMMSVVTGFFFSWLPWTILEALIIFSFSEETNLNTFKVTRTQIAYTTLTIFASGALNPVIYGFLSDEFRSSARNIFCRKSHVAVSPLSSRQVGHSLSVSRSGNVERGTGEDNNISQGTTKESKGEEST